MEYPPDMHLRPPGTAVNEMELVSPSCPVAEPFMADAAHDVADELLPSSDHVGLETTALWLIVGSGMVAGAILAFGWRRTLLVWSASAVGLLLVLGGDRLWYKYVRKSE